MPLAAAERDSERSSFGEKQFLVIVFVSKKSQARREVAKNGTGRAAARARSEEATVSLVYHSDRLSVARGRFDGLGVSQRWGYLYEVWGV